MYYPPDGAVRESCFVVSALAARAILVHAAPQVSVGEKAAVSFAVSNGARQLSTGE